MSIYSAIPIDNSYERAYRWAVNSRDPSWTQTTVIDALCALSYLQDIRLSLHGGPFPLLQLHHLSGLKKISLAGSCTNYRSHIIGGLAEAIAKSPELVYLKVSATTYGHSWKIPTLHDLFSKVPSGSPLRLTHLVLVGMFARIDSHTLPYLRSLVFLDVNRLYESSPANDSGITDHTRRCISTIPDVYVEYLKHVVVILSPLALRLNGL